jgi:hypothetical protein
VRGLSTNTVGLDSASKPFSSNRSSCNGRASPPACRGLRLYNAAVQNYRAGFFPQEDRVTAAGGWAYTAPLGGGLSATISAEERRMNQTIDDSGVAAPAALAAFGRGAGFGGWQAPEIVGNIHIEQAWGIAQIMATGHELNPLYHGPLARIQRRASRGDEAGNRGNQDWLAAAIQEGFSGCAPDAAAAASRGRWRLTASGCVESTPI